MSYSGYSQFTTNLFGSEQYGGGTTASVFGGYQGSWATPAASNHQNQTAPTHYYEQHHTSSVQQPTAATVDSYQQQQYGAGYGGGFGSSSVFGSSSQSRPTNIYENRGRPILGATVGNGFANESRHHQYGNNTGFALESSTAPRPLFGANTFEGRTFSAARSAAAAPFSSRGGGITGISGLSTSSSKFGATGGSNSNSSSRPWRSSIFSSTSTSKPNFPLKSKAAPAASRLRGGSATTALVPVKKATTSTPKKTATVASNSSKAKKNDSPPKSTAAKKIAAVLAKKQQAADQAKPKQETPAAAVDKIKPAKQSFSKAKGRGGVQKNQSPKKQKFLQQQRPGPNFGPGGMNGYGYGGRGGYSMWGGRGGGGRYGGGQKRFMRKRANQQSDIPFTAVPEGEPFVAFPVSSDNIMCFHGFQSVFTTQHMFPVLIDGNIYESCDHYYQIEKTKQLCGQTSEKMTATVRDAEGKRLDGKVGPRSHEEKGFSALAKEMVRLANVSKEKVEEWRHTNGLEIMQKALRAKVSQCPEMRDALRQSGDKILIHCYPGDAIYGSGTRINGVKAWCDELKKNETKLIVPMRFPLTVTSIEHCPVVGKGRNVLGVIMMQLRNLVMSEEIDIIDMSMIFDGLIPSPAPVAADASKDVDDEMNGFAIGGGSIQPPIGTA